MDDLADQLAEMAQQMEALMTENETLTKLISSDTQLADAIKKIKSQEAEIGVLRERLDALMGEKAAAVKAARSTRSKLQKVLS